MGDHHDYKLDKDTPESIQQLTEQYADSAPKSQRGLPAGDRLDNYLEPDETFPLQTDLPPGEAATRFPAYGGDADRPAKSSFHTKEGSRRK
ncbi:MAG TPA: hypothetical protein V6C52_12310 [Coleofasciculaceae cyanobacterium]